MPVPAGGFPILPGSSAPCAWVIDTGCCTDFWATLDSDMQLRASNYATLVLWAATGRQYGQCTVTVRPCGIDCAGGCNGYYWSDGWWVPYIWNGVWRNCWCGSGSGCQSCRPACQVYLPGPVVSVGEVVVDDATIDPATYRVDDGRWLVRVRSEENPDVCWPSWQDYNLDEGTNTFFVTYNRGTAVPNVLAAAAGTLACEYAKACMDVECRLPDRVTSIVRQGITISMVDVDALLERGLTGLMDVDQVITALNPYALKGRTRLLSLDVEQPRMTTWP